MMGGRFPSEIAGVSSREFARLEQIVLEEQAQQREAARMAEREQRLARMKD